MKKRLLAGIIDFAIAALVQSILMFIFIMFPLLTGKLDTTLEFPDFCRHP